MRLLRWALFVLGGMTLFTLALGCSESGINLFSLKDDRLLGQRLHQEIIGSKEYILLDILQHQRVYQELYQMRDHILASDRVQHKKLSPGKFLSSITIV